MANLYMGRGGIDGLFGGQPIMPGPMPRWNPPTPGGTPVPRPPIVPGNEGSGSTPPPQNPIGPEPGKETPQPGSPASLPPNVLGAQSVRASGPSQGYDPAYLQNLATSIGALFSRPQGNLSFNPLGNLSEISPASGQLGNAPGFGEPSTWLQDALNGIAFMFNPPPPPAPPAPNPVPRGPIGRGGTGGIGIGRPVVNNFA